MCFGWGPSNHQGRHDHGHDVHIAQPLGHIAQPAKTFLPEETLPSETTAQCTTMAQDSQLFASTGAEIAETFLEDSEALARWAEDELTNHPPSESESEDDCLFTFDEAWDFWFAAEQLKFAGGGQTWLSNVLVPAELLARIQEEVLPHSFDADQLKFQFWPKQTVEAWDPSEWPAIGELCEMLGVVNPRNIKMVCHGIFSAATPHDDGTFDGPPFHSTSYSHLS